MAETDQKELAFAEIAVGDGSGQAGGGDLNIMKSKVLRLKTRFLKSPFFGDGGKSLNTMKKQRIKIREQKF